MRRRRLGLGLAALATVSALAVFLRAADAPARTELAWPWDAATIWPAAVRYLRVERQFPIREKDDKAGYVIFDYLEGGRSYRGTLEIVGSLQDPASGAKVFLSLADLPRRFESGLLDELAKKLRQENGLPPPRKQPEGAPHPTPPTGHDKPPAEKPPVDGGLPTGLPRAPTLTP